MILKYEKIPKYEIILNGNTREKIQVSRIFKELLQIQDEQEKLQ